MKRVTLTNIDGVVREFTTELEFIQTVKIMAKENGDYKWESQIATFESALIYIYEYHQDMKVSDLRYFKTGGKYLKFIGMDADLEKSLIEYGFVCTNQADSCDHENEYFIIFRMNDGMFGFSYREESDLNDSFRELGSKNSFLNCYDYENEEDFKNDTYVNKLNNLLSYHGHENVIGVEYHPSSREEIEGFYPQIFE